MNKYSFRILNTLLVFGIFIVGLLMMANSLKANKTIPYNSPESRDIIIACNKTDLEEASNCLREEFATWWKYNESNLGLYWPSREVNWSVIKEQGGVCWHAAQWFVSTAKAMGFKAKIVKVDGSNMSHEYAMIWNEVGDEIKSYCILDQLNTPSCTDLSPFNWTKYKEGR